MTINSIGNHNGTTTVEEENMPSITVKNIPEKTYSILKKLAEEHHRSINSEIIYPRNIPNWLTSSIEKILIGARRYCGE